MDNFLYNKINQSITFIIINYIVDFYFNAIKYELDWYLVTFLASCAMSDVFKMLCQDVLSVLCLLYSG